MTCTVCCLLLLQGLVPDRRILSALLAMLKLPRDFDWYMEVRPVLPPFICQPHTCVYMYLFELFVGCIGQSSCVQGHRSRSGAKSADSHWKSGGLEVHLIHLTCTRNVLS